MASRNEIEYEERKRQERQLEERREIMRREDRSEYAYSEWMRGKSYDEAWDKWEADNAGD